MRISLKTLRALLLAIGLVVSVRDYRATLFATPDLCGDVCSSSDCATQCYADEVEFENGNSISCLDYGVYDTSQVCCGDGFCNSEAGEDSDSCYSDCYQQAVGPQMTVLVNGSLNPSMPDWMQPGSGEFNALTATYGSEPILHFWEENDLDNVTWPSYSGIFAGAFVLASHVNALPGGDVNIVAHSHGGNVAIAATPLIGRQVRHLVELATPVNYDVPRYVGGYGVQQRCIASSWSDDVQFFGSSPAQVAGYLVSLSLAYQFEQYALDDLAVGDYDQWAIDQAAALAFFETADYYWSSTKIEVDGAVIGFNGPDHADMHEPWIWSELPGYCKIY